MTFPNPLLFVSVHLGPYRTIKPLAEVWGAGRTRFVLEGPAEAAHHAAGMTSWNLAGVRGGRGTLERFLHDQGVRALIIGTSENLPEDNIETLALQTACRIGLPAFVIEDFPGNYRHRPGYRLDGLFVEDDSMIELHAKQGIGMDRIHCASNPRYDTLRGVDRYALRHATRASLGVRNERVILWAGQPDEASSYRAFERLVPALEGCGAMLWFKAHPRDRLYRTGAYEHWVSDAKWIVDVTADKETTGLCCAADLVVTQFSSVGVEASYVGTPALYVLFYDLGMAYLQRHKGYPIVPWAANRSAFLLKSTDCAQDVLARALHDDESRTMVLRNFHELYGMRPAGATAIVAHIQAVLQAIA